MMQKLIIDNRTELPMEVVLHYIIEVVKLGRISNNNQQYCGAVVASIDNDNYVIYSDLNKKSDKFIIYKQSQ